jgi:hypothetical protein
LTKKETTTDLLADISLEEVERKPKEAKLARKTVSDFLIELVGELKTH